MMLRRNQSEQLEQSFETARKWLMKAAEQGVEQAICGKPIYYCGKECQVKHWKKKLKYM